MSSKASKRIMIALLAFCTVISAFTVNAKAADETSTGKVDDCEKVVKAYGAERVAKYLAGDDTYPTLEGYLFSGWYTDEACDEDSALKGCVLC